MRQKRNLIDRLLAIVTLLFFGVTNTTWAQAPVPISLGQPSNVEVFLPANFTIPETLGSVQPGFSAPRPDKPVVIVIQDAHGVLDAQNNIQKIINHLQTKYGINLIALEGGRGKLDPTLFRTFPDEFVKKKIIEDYLRRGELTGSEMAAIFNKEEGIYYGIEDWDLYEANYLAYLRAMEKKDNVLKQLGAVRENLDKDRRKIYSPKLNEFHEQITAFEAENKYLLEVLKYLGTLEGTRERLSKYPEIEKLFRSFEFEEETSKKPEAVEMIVRKMAESFKAKYLPKMNIKQEMSFHKNYQAFVTGGMQPAEYLKFLIEMGESFGVKARLTPSLMKLLGHSQTLASIQGTELFKELESLLREMEEGLITKPEERGLAEKYRQLNLLRALVSLELTRDQWEELKPIVHSRQSTEEPPKANQDHILWTMDRGLWTDFQPALEFYRLALERDQAFRRNLSKLLKEQKSKSAIVLAGGFHTEGFERNLKEDGISYAVITPKIQSLAGQETYQTVMQGNISYKPYLRTTFYDAFVKDSTSKLANQWSEPDFRKNIKNWRDEVIRRLSKEGRIQQAKDYTRYIDLVLKVYYDKYGKVDDSPEARREILKAMDKELKSFRKDTVNHLWQQFESQFKEFTGGLKSLADRKELNPENVSALLDRVTQPRSATLVQLALVALEPKGPVFSEISSELREFIEKGQLPAERPETTPLLGARTIVDALVEMAATAAAAGLPVPVAAVQRLAGTPAVDAAARKILEMEQTVRAVAPEASPVGAGSVAGQQLIEQIVQTAARDVQRQERTTTPPGAVALAIANAVTQQVNGVNVNTGTLQRAEVRSPGETVTARLGRLTQQPQARVPLSITGAVFYNKIDGASKAEKEETILREIATRSPILSTIIGDIDIQPGLQPNELSFEFLESAATKAPVYTKNPAGDRVRARFMIQTNSEGTEIVRFQASSPAGTAPELLRVLVSYLRDLDYPSVPFVDLNPGSKGFLASTISFWGANTDMPGSEYSLQLIPLTGLDLPLMMRLQGFERGEKIISENEEKELLMSQFILAKQDGVSQIRLVRLQRAQNPEQNYLFFENLLNQWTTQSVTLDRAAPFFDINLVDLDLTKLQASLDAITGPGARSEVRQKWYGSETSPIVIKEGSGTQAIEFNENTTQLVVRVAGEDVLTLKRVEGDKFIIETLHPDVSTEGKNSFKPGDTITGGRDQRSTVRLNSDVFQAASRFHFEIQISPQGLVVISDLFSRNGTVIRIDNPKNLASLVGTEVAVPPELSKEQINALLGAQEADELDHSLSGSGSLGSMSMSLSRNSLDSNLLKMAQNPENVRQQSIDPIVKNFSPRLRQIQNNNQINAIAANNGTVSRLLRRLPILINKLATPQYEANPDDPTNMMQINTNAYYYPQYFARNRRGALSMIAVVDGILNELEGLLGEAKEPQAPPIQPANVRRGGLPVIPAAPKARVNFEDLGVLGKDLIEVEPNAGKVFSYDLPFKIAISDFEMIFDVDDGQLRYYVGNGEFRLLEGNELRGQGFRVLLTGDTILVENTGRVPLTLTGGRKGVAEARSEVREKAQRDPGAQMRILNNLARARSQYPGTSAITSTLPALIDSLTRYLTGMPLETIQSPQGEPLETSSLSARFFRFAESLKSFVFFWFQKQGALKTNAIQERFLKLTQDIQARLEREGLLTTAGQPEWGAGAAILMAFAALVTGQNPGWVIYEFGQLRNSRDAKGNPIFPAGERGDFTSALLILSQFWAEEEPRNESARQRVIEEYREALSLTEGQVTGQRGWILDQTPPYLRETATTLLTRGRENYQDMSFITAATVVLSKRMREESDRLRESERARTENPNEIPLLNKEWAANDKTILGTLSDIHKRWVSLSTQAASTFRKPGDQPYPMEYGFAAALVELGTVLSDYRSVRDFGAQREASAERQREDKEAKEREKGTAGAALEALRTRAAFLYRLSQRLGGLDIPNLAYRNLFQRWIANASPRTPIYLLAENALKKIESLDKFSQVPDPALVLQGESLESKTAMNMGVQSDFWNILEKLPEMEADDAVRKLEQAEGVTPKQTASPQQNLGEALEKLEARVDVLSDALLRLQRLQLTEEEMKVWFDQNEGLSAPEIERNVRELEASRQTLSWDDAKLRAKDFIRQFQDALQNLPVTYRAVNLPGTVNVSQLARETFQQRIGEFQQNRREVFARAARQSGSRDRNAADTMYAITVEDLKEGVLKAAQDVVDQIWRGTILYQMRVGEYNTGTASATESAADRNALVDQAMALQDLVNQTSTELDLLLSTPSPAPETAAATAVVTWQNNPEMQGIRGATPGAENSEAVFNALVVQGVAVIPYMTRVLSDETLRKDAAEGTGDLSQRAQAVRRTAISALERIEQGFSRTEIGNISRMAVVRAVMPLYKDPQLQIRNAAMTVLERLGVEAGETQAGQRLRMSVVTALSELYLKSPYPETRRDTIAALGDIANPSDTVAAQGNTTVVDLLMPHVNDPVEQVQSATVLALGQLLTLPETTNEAYAAGRNKVIRSLSNLIENSTSPGEAFEAAVETLTQLEAPPEVVMGAFTNLLQRIDPEDIAFNERVVDLLTRVTEVNKDNPVVIGSLEILLTKRSSPSNARFGIFQVLDRFGRGETAIGELEASYQSTYDQYLSVGRRVEGTRVELNTIRQSLVETLGRIAGDRIATPQRRDEIANFLIGVLTPYEGMLRSQGEIEDADVMVAAIEGLGRIPIAALSDETYKDINPRSNGVFGKLLARFPSPSPGSDADKVVTAIERADEKFLNQTPPASGTGVPISPAASPPAAPAAPGPVQPSVQPTSVPEGDVVSEEARSELRKVSVESAMRDPAFLSLTGRPQQEITRLAVTDPLGIADLVSDARANLSRVDRQLVIGSGKFLALFRGKSANEIILTIFEPGALTTIDQSLGLGNILAVVDAADGLRSAAAIAIAQLAGIVLIPTAGAFEALPADFQPLTPQALFLLSRPDLLQEVLARSELAPKLSEQKVKLVFDGLFIEPATDKDYFQKQLQTADVVIIYPVEMNVMADMFRAFPQIIPIALRPRDKNTVDLRKKLGPTSEDENVRLILGLEPIIKIDPRSEVQKEIIRYDPAAPYMESQGKRLTASKLGPLTEILFLNPEVRALLDGDRMTANAYSALASIVNRLALDEDVQNAYEAAA